MIDIDKTAEELLFDLELGGWWLHAQTDKPEPFPWMATPPEDASKNIPLKELVGSLNAFRNPGEQLAPEEIAAVADKICEIRVLGSIATALLDPEKRAFYEDIEHIVRGEE